jgi:predicted CoA-binding protein
MTKIAIAFDEAAWIDWTLDRPRRIAVVGLSNREDRDSYKASLYLHESGYEIVPVNPIYSSIMGLKCYPSLHDVPGTVDIVNLFQRLDRVPASVEAAIVLQPKLIWMQLGIVHKQAADEARKAGIGVVMDRCIKIEHQKKLAN